MDNSADVKDDLLLPAIQGTIEILKAAKTYGPTVKRVVVTSSFASISDPTKGDRPGYVYTEKDWNPVSSLPFNRACIEYQTNIQTLCQLTFEQSEKDPVLGYLGSKALAEKAAWDFIESEKPSFDLVTICPPMVRVYHDWLCSLCL